MVPSFSCVPAVLIHGTVCQPFAAPCGLMGTQGWPTSRRLCTQCWPKRVVVCQRALSSPERLHAYAVDLNRRVMEHRRAFGRRVGPGEPLERVVHHVIGKGDFVRRKVAFEHAPLRTELLYTVL